MEPRLPGHEHDEGPDVHFRRPARDLEAPARGESAAGLVVVERAYYRCGGAELVGKLAVERTGRTRFNREDVPKVPEGPELLMVAAGSTGAPMRKSALEGCEGKRDPDAPKTPETKVLRICEVAIASEAVRRKP